MKKKNKIIIGLIILAIILLLIVGSYFGHNYVAKKYYVAGFQTAQYVTAQTVINDLQNNGYTSLTMGDQKIFLAPIQPQQVEGGIENGNE